MGTRSEDSMDHPKGTQDNSVKKVEITYEIITMALRRKNLIHLPGKVYRR